MISQEMSSKDYEDFEGASSWLDEVELKNKYAQRPDQVDAIMEHANTMVHPARKVTLCEDVAYSSKRGTASSHTSSVKRSIFQEDVRKPEKKAEGRSEAEGRGQATRRCREGKID